MIRAAANMNFVILKNHAFGNFIRASFTSAAFEFAAAFYVKLWLSPLWNVLLL